MRRLFSEPFVHFVVAGIVLFAFISWWREAEPEPRRIVVDQERVDRLSQSFGRSWMRPPTPEELDRLVEDYIREEVLYREALALGLDRDDLVVRRRLRQKMEFLSDDFLAGGAPTDSELAAFLTAHPDKFRIPPVLTFEQIFFDGAPSEARERAQATLRTLDAGDEEGSVDHLGDPISLPRRLDRATPREIASVFGDDFANAMLAVDSGRWVPVESSFGVHLVQVSQKEPPRLPGLSEVRDAVVREREATTRADAQEAFYRKLRRRYVVEMPERSREPE